MKTGLKSIFVFAALLLPSLCAYAQKPIEIKEERKGYTGNVEAIVGFIEVIGLNTTHGYRVNNHWSFGANTGLDWQWHGWVVPLCGVAQFDIPAGKSTSVLFNAKAGGAFALDYNDGLSKSGWNFAFGAGLRYKRMSYQLAFNATMIKHYQHDTNEILDGYATLQLRIGFNFGAR